MRGCECVCVCISDMSNEFENVPVEDRIMYSLEKKNKTYWRGIETDEDKENIWRIFYAYSLENKAKVEEDYEAGAH